MLRVTLEHKWQPGEVDGISAFEGLFPEIFADPNLLGLLAYEEYRLRASEGQRVEKAEYARRYGLDVSSWSDLAAEPVCGKISDEASEGSSAWTEFSWSAPAAAAGLSIARRRLPEVGERFGPFQLAALLGQGAFGKVFLARQTTLSDRPVALKVTAGPALEADRLARLQHGNIVPVYSVHRRGKLTGICMPFLGSVTLADLIASLKRHARLPRSAESLAATLELRQAEFSTLVDEGRESLAAEAETSPQTSPVKFSRPPNGFVTAGPLEVYFSRIIKDVAAGLAQAHERGIIHRDLKPANILISDDGQPLLLDFNLAADQSGHIARLGGTLPYMAPEHLALFQGNGPGMTDARSDIYALGVVLYECFTARQPFPIRRDTLEKTLSQMIADRQAAPAGVRTLNPAVSPGLAAIVHKCLEADPSRRYQRAFDLHEDLQRHLDARPLKYARDISLSERALKWCRRHPRLSSMTTLLSLALVVALFAGGTWYSREQSRAKIVAEEELRLFEDQALESRSFLIIGAPGSAWEERGVAAAKQSLGRFLVLENPAWQESTAVRRLSPEHRQELGENVAEILLILAERRRAHVANGPTAGLPAADELERRALATWEQLVPGRPPRLMKALEPDGRSVSSELDEPADVAELVQIAAAMPRGAKLNDTEALLRRLTEVRPRDAFGWLALGQYYLANNRLSEAEAAGNAAVALRGELDLGWQFRGVVHLLQQRWQQAEGDFDAALTRRPQNPAAWFNRGVARQAQGKHTAAVDDFTNAIEQELAETRVYFARARSYDALGEKKFAEVDRQEGLRREPGDALSYVERGLAQLPDHPRDAKSDLEHAVRLDPTSRFTLMNLAHVQSECLGQTREGIETLGKLLEVSPGDSVARGSRAVLYARLGKQAEAMADLKQLLATDNRPPLAIYQAACVYALLGKDQQPQRSRAMQLLSTSFTTQPSLVNTARTDPDLSNLHGEQVWKQLVPPAPK
jgi:eukaryotic-like serine/threonine-protein kinase